MKRYIALLLAIVMTFLFASCKNSKKDTDDVTSTEPLLTSYSMQAKIDLSGDAESTFTVNALDSNYEIVVAAGDNEKLKITTAGADTAFKSKKLIKVEDINFDGFNDISVILEDSGEEQKIDMWLWNNDEGKFEKIDTNDADLTNYKLYPEQKLVFASSKDKDIEKQYLYNFDEDGKITMQRQATVSVNADDDSKRDIRIMDYSKGTFLMYSKSCAASEIPSDDIKSVLFVGFDNETITEAQAEEAVHKIAGSSKSGVSVDCEGVLVSKGVVYYSMRVDKHNMTSSYYFVNSKDGDVKLKQSGSELI